MSKTVTPWYAVVYRCEITGKIIPLTAAELALAHRNMRANSGIGPMIPSAPDGSSLLASDIDWTGAGAAKYRAHAQPAAPSPESKRGSSKLAVRVSRPTLAKFIALCKAEGVSVHTKVRGWISVAVTPTVEPAPITREQAAARRVATLGVKHRVACAQCDGVGCTYDADCNPCGGTGEVSRNGASPVTSARISLALACLPHAGYSQSICDHVRRLLLDALGDRPLEPVACEPTPVGASEIVRDVVNELAAESEVTT